MGNRSDEREQARERKRRGRGRGRGGMEESTRKRRNKIEILYVGEKETKKTRDIGGDLRDTYREREINK